MKKYVCKNCKNEFKVKITIDGIDKNIRYRKYCLDCVPFGEKSKVKKFDTLEKRIENGQLKLCKICNLEKTIDNFNKRTEGDWPRSSCKECESKNSTIKKSKLKKKFVEYKGGKCEKCGYDKYHGAMDFHHKDPNEKDFTISKKSWSLEKIKQELDKCLLLCVNCHRETHFEIKVFKKISTSFDTECEINLENIKKCSKCNIEKSARDFIRRHNICKKCWAIKSIKRKQQIKCEAVKYKGGCCLKCNYDKYYGALEFHHLDPSQKDFTISNCKTSLEKIKPELDKCILVCANCHREIHSKMYTDD